MLSTAGTVSGAEPLSACDARSAPVANPRRRSAAAGRYPSDRRFASVELYGTRTRLGAFLFARLRCSPRAGPGPRLPGAYRSQFDDRAVLIK
jgi:hypothetical protein